MKRQSRTDMDWSKHELIVEDRNGTLVYKLKKPDTVCQQVIFINTNGILAVTGDYYNWIFCREFHPTKEGYVSDHYWCEKLQIASEQKAYEYDADGTEKILKDGLEQGLEEYGYEGNKLEVMKEYYKELLQVVYCSEWEYVSYAYNEYMPDFIDAETVPFCTKIKYGLLIIFDAFDEICRRMEAENEVVK